MPVEASSVRGTFAAASVAAVRGALPRGAQSSGQRESDLVSSGDERSKKEKGSGAVSGAAGRPAEVLRESCGLKSVGERALSAYIRIHVVCASRDLLGLVYQESALTARVLRGAACVTSFLTIRDVDVVAEASPHPLLSKIRDRKRATFRRRAAQTVL